MKSFFLGPQAENSAWLSEQMNELMARWFQWRQQLFPGDGKAISAKDQAIPEFLEKRAELSRTLEQLMSLFEKEVPKFSPRYIGHMFSEIALPAFFGHIIALLHNPNNISGESAPVGVRIEDEAIRALFKMIGARDTQGMGHFTSGGTLANFEAMVRARARLALWLATAATSDHAENLTLFEAAHLGWAGFDRLYEESKSQAADWNFTRANPWEFGTRVRKRFGVDFKGPVVLVPQHKHYSWTKGVSLLGLGEEAFWPIELDEHGCLSLSDLEKKIALARDSARPILMVVSVAGTTELGVFDPIAKVQALLDELATRSGIHIWHHVDAAYGGFFCALDLEDGQLLSRDTRENLKAIRFASSVTLDPHKLGYVPYACGAFLARDPRDYRVSSFTAPYVQFDAMVDRGPFTIEGSRSATGAAATWMIARAVGLDSRGYGRILHRTIHIRRHLARTLINSGLPFRIAPSVETNILSLSLALEGEHVSQTNHRTQRVYEALAGESPNPFFVSKTKLSWTAYGRYLDTFTSSWHGVQDCNELVLLRMCMMNPFFDSVEMNADFGSQLVERIRDALR